MKVSLEELKTYPHGKMGISFKEQVQVLEAVKPVVGELTLSLDSWGLKLIGKVQTLLKLTCHRCLKAYFQNLTVDIDESFVWASDMEVPRERELSKHDFVEPVPDNGVLDISDIVYQAVTLASPTYCLCGEDCPGPAMPTAGSSCGALSSHEKRNIDPRWENLKTLFVNKGSSEGS